MFKFKNLRGVILFFLKLFDFIVVMAWVLSILFFLADSMMGNDYIDWLFVAKCFLVLMYITVVNLFCWACYTKYLERPRVGAVENICEYDKKNKYPCIKVG